MKISLSWLKDFVTLGENDPAVLADRITRSVGEVDELVVQDQFLKHVVVGKIMTLGKHPGADRLSVCDVQTDDGVKHVVCGGSNLRQGMKVAFAHVGATVKWHGEETMTLASTKIRGEKSDGMICAQEELGLSGMHTSGGEHPIVDLGDDDAGVGRPLSEFVGRNDVVFHIDNHAITHRPDLFSHIGVARELVALDMATWKKQKSKAPSFGKKHPSFKMINDIPELIPRFVACMLEWDAPGETPDWMKQRLEATGFRPVSLPVDITNYVMMETGMPLHCFDADDFKGDVHMRTTKEGESIKTLDDVERILPEGAIVLSDDAGIFDLLGIMGGLRSSTKPTTKRAYIHAAIADPSSIRKTIIATGHRTDAATVYEKGIPHVSVEKGLARALELFLELVPGCTITSTLESFGDNGKKEPISVTSEHIDSVLGAAISATDIKELLEKLGCDVSSKKSATSVTFTVTPPLDRNDLVIAENIVEEVGRIYGYDRIDATMPTADITPPKRDTRLKKVREGFRGMTYVEILPLSLTSPELLRKTNLDPSNAVSIENPLGEELSVLQTSTLTALLEHASRNIRLVDTNLRTFNAGDVFHRKNDSVEEHAELTALVCDARTEKSEKALLDDPFLLVKDEMAAAFDRAGYALTVKPAKSAPAYAHPGRSADLYVGEKNVGLICEVHPSVRNRFELQGRAAAATVNLATLFAIEPTVKIPKAIAEFPAVSYDDTVTMSHAKAVGDMLRELRGGHELLENIEVVDLYKGKQHKDDDYNLTLRFTYRAADRTLTEKEAQDAHAKILEGLKAKV